MEQSTLTQDATMEFTEKKTWKQCLRDFVLKNYINIMYSFVIWFSVFNIGYFISNMYFNR